MKTYLIVIAFIAYIVANDGDVAGERIKNCRGKVCSEDECCASEEFYINADCKPLATEGTCYFNYTERDIAVFKGSCPCAKGYSCDGFIDPNNPGKCKKIEKNNED